jgi:hypothetical protein
MKLTNIKLFYLIVLTFLPLIKSNIILEFIHNDLDWDGQGIGFKQDEKGDNLIITYKDATKEDTEHIALADLLIGCDSKEIRIDQRTSVADQYYLSMATIDRGCKMDYKLIYKPFIDWNGQNFQLCCRQQQEVKVTTPGCVNIAAMYESSGNIYIYIRLFRFLQKAIHS